MRKITLLLSAVLFSVTMFAQQSEGAAPLSAGQKQLNFGAGFSGHGIPAYIGLDIAVHNDITVGPVLKVVFGNLVLTGRTCSQSSSVVTTARQGRADSLDNWRGTALSILRGIVQL